MDERILKYFQNGLEANERLLLLREIEKNEELKKQFAEYQNMQALLNLSSHTEDKEEGKTGYQHFLKRIRSKKMHIWLVKTMKYAAAMLILIISTYQLSVWHMSHQLQDDLQAQTNTLYVPAGQRACITLQDGTIVWLNAQSTLIYPSHFYGKERIVSITGEAFFEVSKDKEKPFIVTAQDAKIRVLGTKFNVYSYPDTKQIKTSLIEGAVQVFYKSKQVILRPNEESIAQDGKLTVGNIKNPDMLLWRNGIYSFNNERLVEIVRKLELYYDVTINIANPKLQDICYTCKFRQRDGIEKILYTIQKIHHFKIEINKEKNVITLK
ncbi:FecR family protein [Bacteroides eggerthii]|jgi:ferric-dicitrate binding protein FerR (iron transport regulator)|uniref:FecR family protein n=1 Tax=Bacteroides eggerthii TaxID=28111 RepID=A0A4Q5GJ94_9BACE|nr:FecR family protein [Bacteroides eggerthii]KAA5268796.1 FecR family protein [Bacteroides eggerthii]KAA5285609.1 FecR family protein [Bacteroides eggerthii]RYT68367.1 FecR family protein [Bacteroides eggerthii]